MIIDYSQKRDSIDVSYVDEQNKIQVEELFLKGNGYYKYVECDEFDPNKIPDLKSFNGGFVKKENAKYFQHHNVNEFFNSDVPKNYPEHYAKFNPLIEPDPFSVDIEVMPTEEFGYSTEELTENPITSISFTDKNFTSILFIVKNPEHPTFDVIDRGVIDNVIQDTLKQHYSLHEYKYEIRVFDTEAEMLDVFITCMRNYFHMIIGWNFLKYDWRYIFNRCKKIGIDVKRASPTKKLSNVRIQINKDTHVDIQVPSHRILTCYMTLFKESLVYSNLASYSLDYVCEQILKLNKVSYQGNLRTLYNTNYLRFVGYSIVDTILVMLLHKATNLLTVEFFQSYYTGVPFLKLSQNSISEALVFQELKENKQFLLETDRTNNQGRKYEGGYVKTPTKKVVEAVLTEDFSGFYPNSMITVGMSPEAKIDKIITNDLGRPINEVENQKWLKYKALGYCLAPKGRIYDNTKDSLFTRIEKKLLNQRKVFRVYEDDIYLNLIPTIENKIKLITNNK